MFVIAIDIALADAEWNANRATCKYNVGLLDQRAQHGRNRAAIVQNFSRQKRHGVGSRLLIRRHHARKVAFGQIILADHEIDRALRLQLRQVGNRHLQQQLLFRCLARTVCNLRDIPGIGWQLRLVERIKPWIILLWPWGPHKARFTRLQHQPILRYAHI
jgi:hypothetical protein